MLWGGGGLHGVTGLRLSCRGGSCTPLQLEGLGEKKRIVTYILNNYYVPHLPNCVFASNMLHCSVHHHNYTVSDTLAARFV